MQKLFMIRTFSLDLVGAVELFEEDEAGHLVSEGEGREAPSPFGFCENCWGQARRASDDEGETRTCLDEFLT